MKLPKPRKMIAEKYVAGLSLFKSRRSPIKLSANESALGPSPKAVKSYNSIGKLNRITPQSGSDENVIFYLEGRTIKKVKIGMIFLIQVIHIFQF